MHYVEEYKNNGTVCGYTEEEAELHDNVFIRLSLKHAKGLTDKREKTALTISDFLLYNNIDYIQPLEIFETVDKILNI